MASEGPKLLKELTLLNSQAHNSEDQEDTIDVDFFDEYEEDDTYSQPVETKDNNNKTNDHQTESTSGLKGTKSIYKCVDCDFQTADKSKFRSHEETSHKWSSNKEYKCDQCKYTSYNKMHYERHILKNHLKEPEKPVKVETFKCTHCKYESTVKQALTKHLRWHSNVDKRLKPNTTKSRFNCKVCPYSTTCKQFYENHMEGHNGSSKAIENDMLQCKYCDYLVYWKPSMMRHVRTLHPDKAPPVKELRCDKCLHLAPNKAGLNRHVRTMHKKHKVSSTSDEDVHSANLRHDNVSEPSNKIITRNNKVLQCDQCDHKTNQKQNMEEHKKTHETVIDNIETHQSSGESEKTELGLNETEAPRFQCDKCDYTIDLQPEFLLHQKSHEVINGALKRSRSNSADITSTKRSKRLQSSSEDTDIDIKIEEPLTRFKCDNCDFHTAFKPAFLLHLKSHSKEWDVDETSSNPLKYFKCDKCDYQIAYEPAFLLHLKTHKTPEAVVKIEMVEGLRCGHCDFECSHRSVYDTHVKSHDSLQNPTDEVQKLKRKKQKPNDYITRNRRKYLKCPYCPYQIHYKPAYARHVNQHTVEKSPATAISNEYALVNNKSTSIPSNNLRMKISKADVNSFKCTVGASTANNETPKPPEINPTVQAVKKTTGKSSTEGETRAEFTCDICNFTTKYKVTLTKHKKLHLGVHQHPQNKKILRKPGLPQPLRQQKKKQPPVIVTDNVKRFQCDVCDYKTKYESVLELHKKEEHENKESKEYEHEDVLGRFSRLFCCNSCSYRTKLVEDILKHYSDVHETNDSKDMFLCDLCDYKSKYKKWFEKHYATRHTSKKNFKGYECSLCIFRTIYLKNYVNHRKEVHNLVYNGKTQFAQKTNKIISPNKL